jgi:peptidyl-prolyl cis-trans isomerase C
MSIAPPLLADGAFGVATVGGRTIDASQFEQRARLVAPDQWTAWGTTWEARRRRFLDDVLVAEALLEIDAAAAPTIKGVRDSALARTLLAQLESEVSKGPPARAEIEAYYAQHRREFETPAAIHIWRILVREEKEAREIIAQLSAPSVADFSRLARDRSLDDATLMRAGNLGFVAADGQTEMPELRVATPLFEAASKVRDGEIVKEPVAESGKFAVVWRRSSRPAQRESLPEVSHIIEQRLFDAALAASWRELVERLRREGLRDHHPELLASFEPQLTEPPAPSVSPGARLTPPPRDVRLRPEPGDYGLR